LLPTLQNKLLAKEEQSGARRSTPEPSLVGACETHEASICSAVKVSTAGAMGCTLCVPRSLARVLVSDEPALAGLETLLEVLL
jgi:hypothetical protein